MWGEVTNHEMEGDNGIFRSGNFLIMVDYSFFKQNGLVMQKVFIRLIGPFGPAWLRIGPGLVILS